MDVNVNGQGIGEDVQVDGSSFNINVEVAGTDIIESVSLYNGLTLIQKKVLGNLNYNLTFNCSAPLSPESPYLILVMQQDKNRAWTTPIWVGP